ncbi:hypothetical protein SHKM778_87130 [Streptomyces sp. KM77-8]|uniref:Uncharacterized protein n=1 Tax=Streptomyces haneummycinicus TaxID=3074435 RepID=A0AAT9HYM1_9ACTN
MELDAGVVGDPGRDGQAVGNDGEGDLRRQDAGEPRDRRTGVHDQGAVGGEFGEGGPGDAVLLVGRGGLPLGEVRLEVEASGGDGPAVHPADHSGAVEGLQVPANGLGGHLELLGQRDHVHPAAVTGEPQDLLLALRCVHVRLPPSPFMPERVVSLEPYVRMSGK